MHGRTQQFFFKFLFLSSRFETVNSCLADEAFKQTPTLTESQLRFNRALSQARVVIEQAFGILKGRWRCLYKLLEEVRLS